MLISQGKWELRPKDIRYSINCGDKHIAMVNCYNCEDIRFRVTKEEAEANAELLVSAPQTKQQRDKLLEACKKSSVLNIPSQSIDFIEQCSTNPSMAVYRTQFKSLLSFLHLCETEAIYTQQVIAECEG